MLQDVKNHRTRTTMTPLRLLLAALFLSLIPGRAVPAFSADDTVELPAVWTISQAVEFALQNSPDTAMARQRIAAAQAMVREARSAFYPRLDVSAAYGATDNPMYSFGNILNQGVFHQNIDFNDPGTSDNLNLTTMLNYRFYNGGRDQAGLKAARAGEKASRFEQEAAVSQLGFGVVKTFFTIIQAQENLQARKSAAEAIAASVKVAQARFEAGDLLRADLLNLEVHQSQADENQIQARHAVNLAKRALLNLLGLEQGDITIDPDCAMTQPIPEITDFAQRPELKRLDAAIAAAEAEVERARSSYYPTADAFAGYMVDQGYEFDGSGTSWMAGVKVNFNLFEGHGASARIARAMAQLREKKELRRKTYLAINLEVEQARLALEQANQRMLVTEKMVEQARESAQLSRERFREGLILSSELIDVENRLTNALVRRTVARTAQRVAVADLRRALGLRQFETAEARTASDS